MSSLARATSCSKEDKRTPLKYWSIQISIVWCNCLPYATLSHDYGQILWSFHQRVGSLLLFIFLITEVCGRNDFVILRLAVRFLQSLIYRAECTGVRQPCSFGTLSELDGRSARFVGSDGNHIPASKPRSWPVSWSDLKTPEWKTISTGWKHYEKTANSVRLYLTLFPSQILKMTCPHLGTRGVLWYSTTSKVCILQGKSHLIIILLENHVSITQSIYLRFFCNFI